MTMAGSASVGGRGGAANASSSRSEGDLVVFRGGGGGAVSPVELLAFREKSSAAEDPTARATVEKGLRRGEPTRFVRDVLASA